MANDTTQQVVRQLHELHDYHQTRITLSEFAQREAKGTDHQLLTHARLHGEITAHKEACLGLRALIDFAQRLEG